MTHTPGPWKIQNAYDLAGEPGTVAALRITGADHETVLSASPYGYNEIWVKEADARLIVTAPDLLAMLSESRNAIASLPMDALGVGGDGMTHWAIRDELLDNIDRVIAQARGES